MKLLTVFEPIGNEWRAKAYLPYENSNDTTVSPVTGTIEETLAALRADIDPSFKLLLTCIKCGNSESRDYGVSEVTGICEYCELSEGEKRAIAQRERREEEYVFGPPDVDYPPDRPEPQY